MLLVGDFPEPALAPLFARYATRRIDVPSGQPIPGSYWGESEAGLIDDAVYVRADTPLHSLLHELAHRVCMDAVRRVTLYTDAGGCYAEECAVCYLQLLLADCVPGAGTAAVLADMDAWGYSFREGSSAAWLAGDGREAREWLLARGLIDGDGRPVWRLREVA
jgi:hypothetical protein